MTGIPVAVVRQEAELTAEYAENCMEYATALLSDPAAWLALATLIAMEVVLGIDNLIFISIMTNKLPEAQRSRGRRIGISLALILRLALLGTVAWIVQLTEPVIDILGQEFSWKDIILLAGGCFLSGKRQRRSTIAWTRTRKATCSKAKQGQRRRR